MDAPLHGGERDLEGVGDLGVRQAHDVAEQQRHLEVGVELVDGAPERVDRLELLDGCVEHLQRRDLVDGHEAARPALVRPELVEDAVLRHLEEPRRELAAQGELRQALEDAEEDLLREILGERAVVDEPQHVVVDRRLVRPDDDREGSLVTPLSFAEDRQIRLRKRQDCVSIAPCSSRTDAAEGRNYGVLTRDLPVITRANARLTIEARRREIGELAAVAERRARGR